MPKLLEKTKRIRHRRFLNALEKTGSPSRAAMEVLNIGSRGSKNKDNSARAAGSQMLSRINDTMVDALGRNGVTTDKIAERTNDLLESQDPMFIDKGISQAMKMGLGGGYKNDSESPTSKMVVAIQVVINGTDNAKSGTDSEAIART